MIVGIFLLASTLSGPPEQAGTDGAHRNFIAGNAHLSKFLSGRNSPARGRTGGQTGRPPAGGPSFRVLCERMGYGNRINRGTDGTSPGFRRDSKGGLRR